MYAQPLARALLVSALILGPAAAFAQSTGDAGTPDLATIVAEGADTPLEHQALADYYKTKADAARSNARNHRMMAKHYTSKVTARDGGMGKHCAQISQLSDQQATAYDEMAKAHSAAAAGQ